MDKITTKQKIITAAKNLFSNHGYNETTIDDIITSAGITKGAFYHYFKSKEAICNEIIDLIQNEYQQIIDTLPVEKNPLQKLKILIKQIFELNRTGRWTNCRILLRLTAQKNLLQPPIRQKLDTLWEWYINQYRILVAECRELKLISERLPLQQQIDIILNLLIGNLWNKILFEKEPDDKIIDFIIGIL